MTSRDQVIRLPIHFLSAAAVWSRRLATCGAMQLAIEFSLGNAMKRLTEKFPVFEKDESAGKWIGGTDGARPFISVSANEFITTGFGSNKPL